MVLKSRSRLGASTLALGFAIGLGVGRADPPAAPRGETTLLENERVRVVEFVLEPGVAMGMHSHPRDRVEITLSGGRVRVTTEQGKVEELEEKEGVVFSKASPLRHDVVNLGSRALRAYHVELK